MTPHFSLVIRRYDPVNGTWIMTRAISPALYTVRSGTTLRVLSRRVEKSHEI